MKDEGNSTESELTSGDEVERGHRCKDGKNAIAAQQLVKLSAPMRVQNSNVFDDYVPNATSHASAVFTPESDISRLGTADQIAIHAVVDNIDSDGGDLNVQLEHSGDGRNWLAKNSNPEVVVSGLKRNASNQDWGSDPNKSSNGQPMLTYVRLRIWFSGKTKAGHVKIHITQRDQAR